MGSVLSILSKAPSNQLEKVELMEGTWEAINNPLGEQEINFLIIL